MQRYNKRPVRSFYQTNVKIGLTKPRNKKVCRPIMHTHTHTQLHAKVSKSESHDNKQNSWCTFRLRGEAEDLNKYGKQRQKKLCSIRIHAGIMFLAWLEIDLVLPRKHSPSRKHGRTFCDSHNL